MTNTTKVEIAVIKEQMMQNEKDHQFLKDGQKEVKNITQGIANKLDEFIGTYEKRHAELQREIDCKPGKNDVAPKWVEWFNKGLISAMVAGAIGLVIYLIERHII